MVRLIRRIKAEFFGGPSNLDVVEGKPHCLTVEQLLQPLVAVIGLNRESRRLFDRTAYLLHSNNVFANSVR